MKLAQSIHILAGRGRKVKKVSGEVGGGRGRLSAGDDVLKGVLFPPRCTPTPTACPKIADAPSLGQWMSWMVEAIKHRPEWDIMLIHPYD